MENLPTYVSIVFILTTILTAGIFYKASNNSKTTLAILAIWLAIQMVVALSNFYTAIDKNPLRFLLMPLLPLFFIIELFATKKGKIYIDSLDINVLAILHIIRIPVEIVLFWLFVNKAIPELMTFEGRNFDIISGLTAPVIFYFGFIKKTIGKKLILFWNFFCLGLLINIVVSAVLSAQLPFQQFAFDQPNIAVLYFPFNWLPSFVVPLVLLSHLATIRQLLKKAPTISPK